MSRRATLLLLLAAHGAALAGSFGVTPTRVDLDKGVRSAVIDVLNDDETKLSFQAKLYEWRQTADGRDEYTESSDLIYFPQIFSVNAHEKRIVRVGIRATAPAAEKAYRLFIEEVQEPERVPSGGAQVRVVLRFGVPIFVAPATPDRRIEVEAVEAARGKLRVTLRNLGNQSARFETLRVVRGADTVAEAAGWHVLAGARRTFEIPTDGPKCVSSGSLEVVAAAEGLTLKRPFEAASVLCERP